MPDFSDQSILPKAQQDAASSLASTQRLSELALESGQLGSWSLNVKTQVAQRSLRHDQIFGYEISCPNWTYSTFITHLDPLDRERGDDEYREALDTGKDWEFEARIHRVDGAERWIWARGKHFRNEAGEIVEIVGLVGDVTERRCTEIALRKSEKLAAVGRLASTIAHEINNPLASVTNLLYLARASEDLVEIKQFLEAAEGELQRVSAITSQTLQFQRKEPVFQQVSARELLAGIKEMFAGRITTQGITVEEQHRTAQKILCLDGEIRQVLTNLVSNAVDAMSSGGRLLLRSHQTQTRGGGQGVSITVADTGGGISPEVERKMYDPLFSTKGANGSGLGLWVSLEIVERHHGTLRMRSRQRVEGHGTVFRLFLPCDNHA